MHGRDIQKKRKEKERTTWFSIGNSFTIQSSRKLTVHALPPSFHQCSFLQVLQATQNRMTVKQGCEVTRNLTCGLLHTSVHCITCYDWLSFGISMSHNLSIHKTVQNNLNGHTLTCLKIPTLYVLVFIDNEGRFPHLHFTC